MSNAPLEYVNFLKTKVCMEIPSFFPPVNKVIDGVLYNFKNERRYTNYKWIINEDKTKTLTYTDNGYGWWYTGELESGKHSK